MYFKKLLNFVLGETIVCVLDFKRDVGLWHGILAVILIFVIFVFNLFLGYI